MGLENKPVVASGEWEGVGWTSFCLVDANCLHLEWMSSEILLHSTSNYIQSLATDMMEYIIRKRTYIYMYNWVTLL